MLTESEPPVAAAGNVQPDPVATMPTVEPAGTATGALIRPVWFVAAVPLALQDVDVTGVPDASAVPEAATHTAIVAVPPTGVSTRQLTAVIVRATLAVKMPIPAVAPARFWFAHEKPLGGY
jgi:hypothetical protein